MLTITLKTNDPRLAEALLDGLIVIVEREFDEPCDQDRVEHEPIWMEELLSTPVIPIYNRDVDPAWALEEYTFWVTYGYDQIPF